MKNRDIEKRIYDEFESRKPDLFNKIMEQCPKMNEEMTNESFLSKLKKLMSNKRLSYSFATVSMVVVLALLLLFPGNVSNPEVFSVIAIDVNPSVVLELDEKDKVINVVENNEDAEVIIGDMDLIGVDYNVAVNALIGSMVTKGYISDLSNSVLLSISSGNDVREAELMAELATAINNVLIGNEINGSVIVQNLEFETDAEELAELLDISEAKAELILDVIEVDPRMVVEELALLSINDLNLLLESKNIVLDDVEKTGNASTLGLLSIDDVYQIALTEFGLIVDDVIEYEIELEQEDGKMVYAIEIETDSEEYEVLIDAKDGTLFVELDDEPNDDESNDDESNDDESNDDESNDDESNDDESNDDESNDDISINLLDRAELINDITTALNLNESLIVEFEYYSEEENGITFYEVSFVYEGNEYELEVDAVTGEIYFNSMNEDGFDPEGNDDD